MTSLQSILPKPRNQFVEQAPPEPAAESKAGRWATVTIPPYGKRQGWVPRNLEDFGDGGAFPEIHVAQYPANIGKKRPDAQKSLTLQVDSEGGVQFDAIAKQGHRSDRVVHSKFTDMVAKDIKEGDPSFEKPTDDEIKNTTDKTLQALEKMLEGKIKAKMPKQAVHQTQEPTYIRYTSAQQGEAFNSGSNSRIIRMVEIAKDPMEPPKFRHKKIPRGPPSPPAPVLHSPPKKVSVEEQNEWRIPPCISNWKNPKGYTIPLDKRLAADGRGLQETYISDKFAMVTQALVQAERQAHEDVRLRNMVDATIREKEVREKEDRIRSLAQQAREEKLSKVSAAKKDMDEDEQLALRQREEIRGDKRREIERDFRMSKMSSENRMKALEREGDRDISEKIALGLAKPTASQELMYDQRLFDKSQGISTNLGDDEAYNLYDKPLFAGGSAGSIYRPKKGPENEFTGSEDDVRKIANTERFVPDRGFQGAKDAPRRDGPVEFEAADPFGLDQFMKEAKMGKKQQPPQSPPRQHERSSDDGGRRKRLSLDEDDRDPKRRR